MTGKHRAHPVMAAVSVSPVGEGVSVSRFVRKALEVLERDFPDLEWEVGAMFTTLVGDKKRVFEAIMAMQEAVFQEGALRVSTVIKMDERQDKPLSIQGKLASLKEDRHDPV